MAYDRSSRQTMAMMWITVSISTRSRTIPLNSAQVSCLSWNWNFASGEITSPPQEDSSDPKEATFVQ
jgi:hypothetical protein